MTLAKPLGVHGALDVNKEYQEKRRRKNRSLDLDVHAKSKTLQRMGHLLFNAEGGKLCHSASEGCVWMHIYGQVPPPLYAFCSASHSKARCLYNRDSCLLPTLRWCPRWFNQRNRRLRLLLVLPLRYSAQLFSSMI